MDINFAIRSTMTNIITEDEIDNYVDTLTDAITSAIVEKVPTKTIKRNSIGLPIEIRESGDIGKRPEYHSTRQTLIIYSNELARTLLPGRETAGKCTARHGAFRVPRCRLV